MTRIFGDTRVRLSGCAGALLLLVATTSRARADSYDDEVAPVTPDAPDETPTPPQAPVETGERPLDAGGLEAPGAMPEKGEERSQTERELDTADRDDSGRGLEFVWLTGELGFQAVDLRAAGGEFVGGPVDSGASGVVYGGAIGLRVLYFTFGARFRNGSLSHFDLWSLAGEGALHLPFGHFEPYATLGVGYTALTGLVVPGGASGMALSASGVDVRAALGADYYLSDTFSVGGQVGGDLLFLSRAAASGGSDPSVAQPGSSVGLGLVASVLVGLHF